MRKFLKWGASFALVLYLLGSFTVSVMQTPKGMAWVLNFRAAIAQSFQVGPNATILGKLLAGGSPPTIAAVGGSPTMANGSTDFAWQFTAAGNQQHVLTFSSTWGTAPFCVITNQTASSNGPPGNTVSATAITFTGNGMANAQIIQGLCIGRAI